MPPILTPIPLREEKQKKQDTGLSSPRMMPTRSSRNKGALQTHDGSSRFAEIKGLFSDPAMMF